MISHNDMQKPVGLNEWAYNSIRSQIITDHIPPGTQLNIEDLSKQLKISRTPIREALLRLAQDGLVCTESRVGFFVSGMTKKEFLEVCELRTIIESYAAERAAISMSPQQRTELEAIFQQFTASEGSNADAFVEIDDHFHGIIVDCLDNDKVRATMNSIASLIYRFRTYINENDRCQAIAAHAEIVSAINENNPEKARQAMIRHQKHNEVFLINRIPFDEA